ncbi:MAG: UDP-N-acetylmuramate dehydrogenase [Anaerolineae bacterium]|jgi:UDP-N-acetylmuramate dehydrogenase
MTAGLERLTRALYERGYEQRLRVNEPLARYTSFAIGGPADLLIVANRLEELQELINLAAAKDVPVTMLGSGTNVLVADAGIRGLVVINNCQAHTINDAGMLTAQSGCLLRELARWTVEQSWKGLEWAVGVPGTLGGAVVGNAGAYGGSMSDIVRRVKLLRPDGSVAWSDASVMEYAYRTSALKRQPHNGRRAMVLEVDMQLSPGDPQELRAVVERITEQRQMRTPEGCCAGSIFKRTMQYPAGFLIEQAGLKGYRVGGAEVSPKHANFLMNTDGATAADVKALIEHIQARVLEAFGQLLEPEIEFVGEWPAEDRGCESAAC